MSDIVLGGDIGGTKTHLALFDQEKIIADSRYKSADYEDLRTIVKEFMAKHPDLKLQRACFGIAGPVQEGVCRATNLPWVVDAKQVAKDTGISEVFLINDLEANAFGINCLKEDEFFSLNTGKQSAGNRALISAGTGLGEAGIYWDGEKHSPFACEGGHCSFAPENEVEFRLLKYLKKQYDHVSFERILSGPGLIALYRFLIDEGIEKEREDVKLEMEKIDPSRVITDWGVKNICNACARALDLFVAIYGAEAGNLALKMFSVGGLYIGGGIAPKILQELADGGFMKRFIEKGRFASLLLGIPVKVVLNENTALLGAAYYARR